MKTPKQNNEETYLNIDEAAELLKIKKKTLYQHVWRKKIPAYKPFGGNLLFRKDEVLAIIEKSKI